MYHINITFIFFISLSYENLENNKFQRSCRRLFVLLLRYGSFQHIEVYSGRNTTRSVEKITERFELHCSETFQFSVSILPETGENFHENVSTFKVNSRRWRSKSYALLVMRRWSSINWKWYSTSTDGTHCQISCGRSSAANLTSPTRPVVA